MIVRKNIFEVSIVICHQKVVFKGRVKPKLQGHEIKDIRDMITDSHHSGQWHILLDV